MTGNREDYIKAIYELGGELDRISTKNIALALNISPPSVSEMIKKLVYEGVIEYKIYRGVKLTRYGVTEAIKIKKRHILWEVFLVEKLGYSWEDVHEEAELLEHITSDKLEERLERYLGYPEICPHGTPLSHDDYLFNYISLDKILIGDKVVLKRLEDDKEVLRFIKGINLNIGDEIRLMSVDLEDNTYKIEMKEKTIEINGDFAKKIYVK